MAKPADNKEVKIAKDKQGIITVQKLLPAFAGGESALENYIVTKIEYPDRMLLTTM